MNTTSLLEARRGAPGLLLCLIGGLALASLAAGCAADEADDPGAPGRASPLEGDDGDCLTVRAEFGLLCTTCAGDAEPECLVASCDKVDACTTDDGEAGGRLDCVDPRGRRVSECSAEWSGPTSGFAFGHVADACMTSTGLAAGSTSACHWPGPDTCAVEDGCVSCMYATGVGSSVCGEGAPTMEELLASHPAGLPGPGQCVTEKVQGGLAECSTCTLFDGSAAQACRFAEATCDQVDPAVIRCDLMGGGQVLISNTPVE